MDTGHPLVERLAATTVHQLVFNPYAGDDLSSANRRHNLSLYLRRMATRRPRILLLGEAPGYRGCRVTGVPFTSESILLADGSSFDLFGAAAGFRSGGKSEPAREATATVVWTTLIQLGIVPLLWNAFPFHPHQPGRPDSNRPPTTGEIALGRDSLLTLLGAFGIEQIIAVGNKAAQALAGWGIAASKVRHPGHGGGAAFRRELAIILAIEDRI